MPLGSFSATRGTSSSRTSGGPNTRGQDLLWRDVNTPGRFDAGLNTRGQDDLWNRLGSGGLDASYVSAFNDPNVMRRMQATREAGGRAGRAAGSQITSQFGGAGAGRSALAGLLGYSEGARSALDYGLDESRFRTDIEQRNKDRQLAGLNTLISGDLGAADVYGRDKDRYLGAVGTLISGDLGAFDSETGRLNVTSEDDWRKALLDFEKQKYGDLGFLRDTLKDVLKRSTTPAGYFGPGFTRGGYSGFDPFRPSSSVPGLIQQDKTNNLIGYLMGGLV